MKSYTKLLSSFIVLLICGCAETPEMPTSKESTIHQEIQQNKTEAEKIQEEYLKIQRQRA